MEIRFSSKASIFHSVEFGLYRRRCSGSIICHGCEVEWPGDRLPILLNHEWVVNCLKTLV